jgi:peroxisomal membrane protein 4
MGSLRHDATHVLHAALSGAVYGAKIRGPHALVMALVFGRSPLPVRARSVVAATVSHSRALALYAGVYTLLRAALLKALGRGRARLAALTAGACGGALVWGDESPISTQLNLYLLSRILSGLARAAGQRLGVRDGKVAFRLWSMVMWGAVMAMYESDGLHEHMQASLLSSMKFIYAPREPGSGVARGIERRDLLVTAGVWAAFGALTAASQPGLSTVSRGRG